MSQNIENLLRSHGYNSNSFLALYPGYNYFYLDEPGRGCIPYIRTRTAWVGLAEPLAPAELHADFLKAFSAAAASEGKAAAFLPVGKGFRATAEANGFRALQIGSEPFFDLKLYPPLGRDWLDVSHSARSLKGSKGFVVSSFEIETTSRPTRLELGQILQDWIESRKMGELGFVNRVEPYTLPQFKKYFMVQGQDRIWAFLCCIPVLPTRGWYFIDVIRRKDSPAGSVELLMLEAMKMLRAEGASWVSLGVSPLAKLEQPARGAKVVLKVASILFRHFQWFYNFQSLFQFKAKFHPSEWRPSYVVHSFPKTDLRVARILTDVFVPQGPGSAILQMIRRKLDLRAYLQHFHRWISASVIPRSALKSPVDLLVRAPLSLSLMLTWLLFFSGHGASRGEKAFSFASLLSVRSPEGAWDQLILPGFLHWNFAHLSLNLLMFAVVGMSLEIFFGTLIVLVSYGVGHLFSNALTGASFWTLSHLVPLESFNAAVSSKDVGASLGIFGCAGVWSYLLKNRTWAWVVFPVVILLVAAIKGDYFQLNHVIAALLGWLVARLYFGELTRA